MFLTTPVGRIRRWPSMRPLDAPSPLASAILYRTERPDGHPGDDRQRRTGAQAPRGIAVEVLRDACQAVAAAHGVAAARRALVERVDRIVVLREACPELVEGSA